MGVTIRLDESGNGKSPARASAASHPAGTSANTDTSTSPEPKTDGRHSRSAQSREAVCVALLELLREGELQPTAQQIADRAGISARSVFRLFSDLNQLFAFAALEQQRWTARLFDQPPETGPRSSRISELVRRRARYFEETAPVRRATALYLPFYSALREDHDRINALLRAQLEAVFASELAACPRLERDALLESLDALTSWLYWQQLREFQGLDADDTRLAVETALDAVLGAACPAEAVA